ncbi:hypothetical protein CEUSTIGMA_g706.t1 [Chlamydomonas eustigma]|uniref:Uncharacterized protein n=1 Tax=Chlamydomonas eustigma TaxID=1157962 RepID=A0A250WRF4_9CHLO|nr:hypothetical protein CEUSTIGMA_g706.t1 [Chlamydomonas eustigma]|eukprot:GAX73252.1 hypothetical protein CEUSTIGMA_g706.t1 [Chlamydomonas eustigma]
MSADVYTVPEQITYRNFDVLSQISPEVPCKLSLELQLPENEGLNYIQDLLVICIGDYVLEVPLRAVRQSLDPAGGPQLQTIMDALPFWPSTSELQQASLKFQASIQAAVQACVDSTSASDYTNSARSQSQPTQSETCPASLNFHESSTSINDMKISVVKQHPGLTLPPDTFSRVDQVSEDSADFGDKSEYQGEDYVITKKPTVVNGRKAVADQCKSAVPELSATSTSAMPSATSTSPMTLTQQNQEVNDRPAATSADREAVSPDTAFILDGRYFDSRGRDITEKVLLNSSFQSLKIVDLGPPRASAHQSTNKVLAGKSEANEVYKNELQGLQSELSGSQQDGYLGSAGSEECTSKIPVSTTVFDPTTSSTSEAAAKASHSIGQQALAAAMKVLGLEYLPPPADASTLSHVNRQRSGGTAGTRSPIASPAIDMRLRPLSGGSGRLGRPASSGRTLPGVQIPRRKDEEDGLGDMEDDFETRLQRNIDMGMPPGSTSSSSSVLSKAIQGRTASSFHTLSSSTSMMSMSAAMAPLPPLRRQAPSQRPRSAAPESQLGYGGGDDDKLDKQLQQQIEQELASTDKGTSQSVTAHAGVPSSSKNPSRKPALFDAVKKSPVVISAVEKGHLESTEPSQKSISMEDRGSRDTRTLKEKVVGPAIAGKKSSVLVPQKMGGKATKTKPSPEQLRSMQAAWDAL